MNRITSFGLGGTLNQQYNIDSFGNMSPITGGSQVASFDPTNLINNLPCASATTSYDAAGNQLCDTDGNGAVRTYAYNAESRLSAISMLNNSSFENYGMDASGNRVRKANADGTWTEYTFFNGQVLAEKDQNGTWTDYIYASDSKVAKVNTQVNAYRFWGNHVGWHMPFGVSTDMQNFSALSASVGAIKTGDTLSYDTRSANPGMTVYGGGYINVDGAPTAIIDSNGNPGHIYPYSDTGWHHLIFDLSGNAGHSLTGFGINLNNQTDWCNRELDFANIVLTRADGTIIPILTSNAITTATYLGTLADGSNQDAGGSEYLNGATEKIAANDEAEATHYYLSDHLGTTQIEFAAGGWPIWQGQFSPFGQELYTQTTENHYKFTGKERDAESGLDYFGARYYGSNMGRFMSPDDGSDQNPGDPQSLNLYPYARNNPIANTDPTGNDCVTQTRTSSSTESVSVNSGNCSGNVGDGQSQTYVNGTVTGISVNGGNSLDIGYNSYDGQSSGVTNAASAPTPDRPGLAYGYGNNAQGYQMLGAASRAVNTGTAIHAGVFAAGACAVYCPGAAAAALTNLRALTGLIPAVPSAIDKLQKLGISLQRAREIVQSEEGYIDNNNGGMFGTGNNVNYIVNEGGKMIRITTDAARTKIISAGRVAENFVSRGVASGRLTSR